MGMLMFKHIFFRSFVGFHGTFLLFPVCLTQNFTASPLFPKTPFLWVWNAPTDFCEKKHSIKIDLSLFPLEGSPRENIPGQGITLFYIDKLGYYPYIDPHTGDNVNGGIPQLGCLKNHLDKATNDICSAIGPNNVGLAVIDWEEWRPIWPRNWSPKHIYKEQSIELVQRNNLQLNYTEASKIAKVEFEAAGKNFMLETLKLGKLLRPKFLWGYYLFPDCYNHNYNKPGYNGSCFDLEKRRNDELHWLWKESTALYPSIYLNTKMKLSQARLFVRNRVLEGIRVSKVRNVKDPLPVFAYFRPVFTDLSSRFLAEKACMNLDNYMKDTLNPYIINVTLAAKMCSQVLCEEQGVCTRKDWNSSDYLHLNSRSFTIQMTNNGKYVIYGKPTLQDLQEFSQKFHCSCYAGVTCKTRVDVDKIDTIQVCVAEDICIDAFLNSTLSDLSQWNERSSTTSVASSKEAFSISCTTKSPHVPGKDLNENIETKHLLDGLSNNYQEELSLRLCNVANKNETTNSVNFFAMGMLMFKSIFFRMFVGFHGTFLLFPVYLMQDYRASPVYPETPFLWVSNAPTELCEERHSIKIDMSLFTLSGSPRKEVTEQGISIFYIDKLGYYPYIDPRTGENVNGGLPQLGCLKNHLDKAAHDIRYYIGPDKVGLAVIDWQEWRPIWARNWSPKHIYKDRSIDIVLKQNSTLALNEATNIAKAEFEGTAKSFMLETLKLGESLRPKYFWGFYRFPDCYNTHYKNPDYNGSCVDLEMRRNDDLDWLWKESTALYPSIYLNSEINNTRNAALFVRNRVLEAVRVSKVRNVMEPLPVFVYLRPVFADKSDKFLSMADLVDTIGESVALGASGMVIWGSFNLTRTLDVCKTFDSFMKNLLNPYIINVTLAAKMCSQVLCQEQGMCIRKNWNSSDYLHLNPRSFVIKSVESGNYTVYGKPSLQDLQELSQKFHCSCFSNVNCVTTVDVNTVNHTRVCIAEGICIDASLTSKLSDSSYWNERSIANNNISFSTPLARVSPCIPGKEHNTKCLVEVLSKSLQKDSPSHLYIQDNKNKTTSPSISSVLIKFPIYIFYVLIAFTFLHLSIFFRIFIGVQGTFLLFPVCLMQDYRASPLYPNTPYLWGSIAPTELCDEIHSIKIDMSLFTLSGSPHKQITEQGITTFTDDKLGYYPYIDPRTGENVNGGIPQLGCLKNHLDKATNDIRYYIASDKLGLAVIDWKGWRSLWGRNRRNKEIYKEQSIDLVLQNDLSLPYSEAVKIAEVQFEAAAKSFMQETLKLGKLVRPKYLWGFYLYSDCFSKAYQEPGDNGTCFDLEKKRNDDLSWLWKESTAIYPLVYLTTEIANAVKPTMFVRNRVLEALRVSQMHHSKDPLPVFAYFLPVFSNEPWLFLSKDNLVDTIGESVALGVSGLVMWGPSNMTESLQDCRDIEKYVKYTLNPYLINVTLAAKMCSQVLCQEQGVCTRKDWNSSDYLHLNPKNFVIQIVKGSKYTVHGNPTVEDLQQFSQKFNCSCYSNINCKTTEDMDTVNHIHVCFNEDVCIKGFVNSKLSDPSRWNRRPSFTDDNVSFSIPPASISACVPGKDLKENLKPKCLMEALYNFEEDSQSHLYIQDNENETTSSSTSSNIFFRIFVGFHGTFLLFPVYLMQDYRASPLYPNTPYLWVSNAPTELCDEIHSIKIDMSLFTLSGSPRKQITEQELDTGENVNGGIPQLGCLKNHLDKATNDIRYYIASDKLGLAAHLEHKLGPRNTYKNESIELVLKQNLKLTFGDAAKIAEVEFQKAGKSFMQETLKLGKLLWPKFLWGFYLFPDCYNRQYNKSSFKGSCIDADIKRNNDLNWLWKESTAIYPSIYLNTGITDSQKAAIYVQNSVLEALRVSQMHNNKDPLPVFVYFCPVFTNVPETFLSKDDLVNTIGESIALGVSGLVLWGDYDITQSMIACKNIEDFMTYTLNPYLINVTLAAKMCSQVLCQEQGVCTRKDWNLSDYLHLNPKNFVIQIVKGSKYTVHGNPTVEDLQQFSQKFNCSCYSNINCKTTEDMDTVNDIHVCINDNICIDAFLKSKLIMSHFLHHLLQYFHVFLEKTSRRTSKTEWKLSSTISKKIIRVIYIFKTMKVKQLPPTSSVLIKFPIYILHVLTAWTFLYLAI
ncbi:LOW QUALITY PROTEIN: Hyaluronidase PH-20 [Galemys pyrenaicus]|uniref:Hyaluronidase n=1 Tax=Galemys pyrenaicus TaxID=202257 RepID=A0A8J6AMW5_GALPY|nr:LOW QUALITY PROTEIN: Hyaluronidase PH-20 [Galemys pyrenaicus]